LSREIRVVAIQLAQRRHDFTIVPAFHDSVELPARARPKLKTPPSLNTTVPIVRALSRVTVRAASMLLVKLAVNPAPSAMPADPPDQRVLSDQTADALEIHVPLGMTQPSCQTAAAPMYIVAPLAKVRLPP
jgi:hypothetical protein